MDMYINLLKSSIKIAYNHKRTCLLGFMQFFAIYVTIKLLNNINLLSLAYLLALILIISFTTVLLWKYIESIKNNKILEIETKKYFNLVVRFGILLCAHLVFISIAKNYHLLWNYSVVVICFLTVLVSYILLGLVLLSLSIKKAYFCALDFIKNKFGVFYSFFVVLLLINIFSYYVVHSLINIRVLGGGFSVLLPSATIWLVFLGIALLATFFSGLVNIFIVLLFLELSKVIKDPKEIQTPLVPAQVN